MRAAIVANINKDGIIKLVPRFIKLLREEGIEALLEDTLQDVLDSRFNYLPSEKLFHDVEMIITFGGDGTILRTARLSTGTGIPILGINLGKVGFLAEISPEEIDLVPTRIKNRKYEVLDRMAFSIKTNKGDSYFALNDVVLDRNADTRILSLSVDISDDFAGEMSTDGLIVSTPTGSTAHSMAAGGPLVMPECEVFVLTPICSHSLANRPMIIDGSRTIKLGIVGGCARMAIDGQSFIDMDTGSEVVITKHVEPVRIARFRDKTYFDILHTRLRWGVSLKLKNA